MKTIMLTLAFVVVGLAASASTLHLPAVGTGSVQVKERSKRDLLVLTTQRSMRGARVQVFHESGDLVTAQKLKRRKMIIDFCDVSDGNYVVVVVSKNGTTEKFQYEKR
jgi:hypothetical protein